VATPNTFAGTILDTVGTPATPHKTALTVNSGSLTLSGFNTYSGKTTLNGGKLTLATSGTIANTSQVVVNGGTLNTGGLNQSMTGTTLQLLNNSTIDLGDSAGNPATVTFADSHSVAWTAGKFLRISNWTGAIAGGGLDQLLVGVGGLGAAQLNEIHFTGYTTG